jgi:hypothetical protein
MNHNVGFFSDMTTTEDMLKVINFPAAEIAMLRGGDMWALLATSCR